VPERPTDTATEPTAEPSAADRRRPALDPLADLRLDPPTWRERLEPATAALLESPMRLAAAAVVVVVALAAIGWFLQSGRGSSRPLEETLPTASAVPAPAPSTLPPTTVARTLVAHAAGAVVAPGVYELETGSRVADLIDAAGGLTSDADADRLNLAGPLADGTRLFVPRVGQPVPDEIDTGAGPASDPEDQGSLPAGEDAPGLVDLNRADVAELDTLPGVGPTTAQAIVDHRSEHGPFTSVDDLIDVRGIGEAKLAQLRDLVRV
jgi:competence protein ComEA